MLGRRTKLTPAVQTAICDALRLGVPLTVACDRVEIERSTVLEWIARGEDRSRRPTNKLYADFASAVKKARADDVSRRVARLEKAGTGGNVLARKTVTTTKNGVSTTTTEEKFSEPQWTADMTHLERRYPDDWGRRDRHQLVGDKDAPLAAELIVRVLGPGLSMAELSGGRVLNGRVPNPQEINGHEESR